MNNVKEDRSMKKNERTIWFLWNSLAVLFILLIACFIFKLMYSLEDNNFDGRYYVLFLGQIVGAFIISLMLQGEKIRAIIRRRKSLVIRWELIIISIIAIFFALMKFWLSQLINLTFKELDSLSLIGHRLLQSEFADIALMFAAGMLIIRAFHVLSGEVIVDSSMKKKERKIWLVWNSLAILLILVVVYCHYKLNWYLLENGIDSRYYILLIWQIISAFIFSLALQGEEIRNIIRRRKKILIRWELLVLSIIAILLSLMKFWLPYFMYYAFPECDLFILISQKLLRGYFIDIALMFAAGMLIISAFHVLSDESDIKKNEINEDK